MVGQSRRRASSISISVDRRWDWLLGFVSNAFPQVPAQVVRLFGNSETVLPRVYNFLDGGEDDPCALYFFADKESTCLRVEVKPPVNIKRTCVYAVKMEARPISGETFHQEMTIGELPATASALPHLSRVTQSVYSALLRAHAEEQDWGDTIANQVMETFGTLVSNVQVTLGEVRGVTCLPLPPDARLYADSYGKDEENLPRRGSRERRPQLPTKPHGKSVPPTPERTDRPSSKFGLHDEESAEGGGLREGSSGPGDTEREENEIIHVLESSLITWTKQIKNVLKQEPEASLASSAEGSTHHPGPLEELEFWEKKSANLNGIFQQLQSDRVRNILRYLDGHKSTYSTPFAKLCKEVCLARAEANDTTRHLQLLRPWLQRLEAETNLENLPGVFRPVLHMLLLVWKRSGYYNTSTRLVVFMRKMCNTLIARATDMLDETGIFCLIEEDQQSEAINLLEMSLKVMGNFKTAYFDYKGKAALECLSNPWRVQNKAVFVRLDAFLERCHDIRDVAQTTALFQKLANLEVGGTKGKAFTTLVAQIHADFCLSLAPIRSTNYNIMDLDAAETFETNFQAFRTSVKSLERRLASVVANAFDDCPTLRARFRLLDCFSGLVQRPAVADELQRKHVVVVEDLAVEVATVMQLFVKNKDDPPIAKNLPPVAGALAWSKGLLERVSVPMRKVSRFDIKVLETEEARELAKHYTLLVGQLADFENKQIQAWGASIQESIEEKLKNPLLLRSPNSTLRVNFNPLVARLLREVKYFLLLGLRVPASALEVYGRAELFRRHTGNLDLIVQMHNNIEHTLLPVERSLLQQQLDSIEQLMARGAIGESCDLDASLIKTGPTPKGHSMNVDQGTSPSVGSGVGNRKKSITLVSTVRAQTLNWRSAGIDVFIGEAMAEVKDLSETLAWMKGGLKRLETTMRTWSSQPLFERGPKMSTPENFEHMQKKVVARRCAAIREGGLELHELLKDTNRKLKISAGLPDWKNYMDFVNSLVIQGLVKVVVVSLAALNQEMSQAHISNNQLPPMLEVEMHLSNGKVSYVPEIGGVDTMVHPDQVAATASQNSNSGQATKGMKRPPTVRSMAWGWVEGFLDVSNAFHRLDSPEGTYLKEIQNDPEVRGQISKMHERLNAVEEAAAAYKKQFSAYEYLWKTDLKLFFREFLNEASYDERFGEDEETPPSSPPDAQCRRGGVFRQTDSINGDSEDTRGVVRLMDLAKFDEKIHFYLGVQSKVAALRHSQDLGFVRVNAQPIKQAISTWVTKWIYVFSQGLQDHVSTWLERISSFIASTQKGLDAPLKPLDKGGVITTTTHIQNVRKMAPMVTGLFGPLKDTVLLLKTRGIRVDLPPVNNQPALEYLESAHMLWDSTVNKAYRVKGEIQPLQNIVAEGVREDVATFGEEVKAFVHQFTRSAPFEISGRRASSKGSDEGTDPGRVIVDSYKKLDKIQSSLRVLEDKAASLRELEELFELSPTRHTGLVEVRSQLCLLKMVWDTVGLVDGLFASWNTTLWAEVRADNLLDEVDSLRLQIQRLPKRVRNWSVFKAVDENVLHMATVLPLIHALHSPAMRDRHWQKLLEVTAQSRRHSRHKRGSRKPSKGRRRSSILLSREEAAAGRMSLATVLGPSFSLEDALSLELQNYTETCMETVEVANKEMKVQQCMQKIENRWTKEQFGLIRHKDTKVFVLHGADDVLEALEEDQMQLQGIAGMGKFVDIFREEVTHWQGNLGEVETILKFMLTVQRAWASLEAIFLTSEDIKTQLPKDTRRFEGIDQKFKDLMKSVSYCPAVATCCLQEGRGDELRGMHAELEECERALNEYLDVKKNVFPRFFFVSNAALLDILSNGNNPLKIQPHLGSMFEGIGSLEFSASEQSAGHLVAVEDDQQSIRQSAGIPRTAVAMLAKDGERVPFFALFHVTGAVELWLTRLVVWMQKSLRLILDEALREATLWEIDKPREEWLFGYPAELALLASQILWTGECEKALEESEYGTESAVRKQLAVCCARLEGLIKIVQGELTRESRAKVIALITIDVHGRDVVQALIDRKVESNLDFVWQSRLRYNWTPQQDAGTNTTKADPSTFGGEEGERGHGGRVEIKICDFRSAYSFELVGNCARLVITPLTDRCYVTLTTALRLMLGGAPAGPAGTGKTETTKDLAKGLGLPCYVFNCSDQMNYRTMADIFKGLTQVGAWGCLDEFNRISIEVLSVVASQVKCIQDAMARLSDPGLREPQYQHLPAGIPNIKVGSFDFLGEIISLVPTYGLFITMNPGYAGRTELPENLKALFRSCAMIKPDLRPICETMLVAEGFVEARTLAVKFIALYSLSSEIVSKQFYYDWGLRAVKSVLLVAGKLKRSDPELAEEAVLMRALRDYNMPKIVAGDTSIFLRLLADIFPSINIAPKVNEDLSAMCARVCVEELSLQSHCDFVAKVVQLEELLHVRHSVMVLGPAGCGKTTVWQTLMACHNYGKAKPSTIAETVNPKAVTSDELYGYMTLAKEWRDGVLPIIMRNMSKDSPPFGPHQTFKWVVLDGDIDSVWIESMNTLMDDSKVLTIVSNERILMTEAMRMLFEVHSLKNATPATVSRAGILFVNENDIGWRPYMKSWVQARPLEIERAVLEDIFRGYIPAILEMLKKNELEALVPIPTICMIQTVCLLLEGLLPALTDKTSKNIERVFLFAAMWAFGGVLSSSDSSNQDDRKTFSQEWRKLVTATKRVKLPEQGLVFDYFFNLENGEVFRWSDKVPEFTPSVGGGKSLASLVVPTIDFVRLTFLTNLLVGMKRHVMLIGSVGTGKTTLVQTYLRNVGSDTLLLSCTINANYYTDAAAIQHQLEQPLDKRGGQTYGPPSSKRLLYFVDDLNMPYVEEYGTQTPVALLRQFMDYRGWFDRDDLGLRRNITDVQFVGAMNHKSGSRSINPRLQRHFVTLVCQTPDDDDLTTIYGTVIGMHLETFPAEMRRFGAPILEATVCLYRAVCSKFLPTAARFYYNFNMRDLSSIVQGLCMARLEHFVSQDWFARLWRHECERIYSDRLVSEAEVKTFDYLLRGTAKKHFGLEPDSKVFGGPDVFTPFAVPSEDLSAPAPYYVPVPSMDVLKHELERRIEEYNKAHVMMNLVLFDQAMQHVARIARILQFPTGHALLLGVGGSGKQTLCRLASFIAGCEVAEITVTSDYGLADLQNTLKNLCWKAGVKSVQPIVFMLTDSQIVDERFLVFVNDILISGVIPDLFTKEEFNWICQAIRIAARSAGVPDVRDSLIQFFFDRVKTNLHVVLCFSPAEGAFRARCRRFPGLVNCCQIDWFRPWPRDALVRVSLCFLSDLDLGDSETKENIAHHMAEVHGSVNELSRQFLEAEERYNYTTPKNFLELIDFYKDLLRKRQGEQNDNIARLTNGLETLRKTNGDAQTLKHDLRLKMKEVEARKRETEVILGEMGIQRSEMEAQQAIADMEKAKADMAASNANAIELAAEIELAAAKPPLIAAQEAVNCLDKASLIELRSFNKPPPGVELVTTALLIMVKLEKKSFGWDNARKMMARVDVFKKELEEYRGEDIPEEIVKQVERLLKEPEFTYSVMRTKSAAAANLCKWVINTINFNQIYKKVKPLMDALESAQEAKAAALADLAKVEDTLATIKSHLGDLERSFIEAIEKKNRVEEEARVCEERLGLAERLTNGLANEYKRWGEEVERLRRMASSTVGDVMLAAAFVTYAGAFSKGYRQELWQNRWLPDLKAKAIPLRVGLNPLEILTSKFQVDIWQDEGLPSDRISTENGGMITQCRRWPLLIDPQLQGIRWLRRHEEVATEAAGRSLHVLQMGETQWMKTIVTAIRQGHSVIVENCPEDIDAALSPVLQRAVLHRGNDGMFLNVGGENCEYDPAFRLYLQSRLSNPHYRPEVFASCAIINFTVTERGLEDQLLSLVVESEQPKLEMTKNDLTKTSHRNKRQLEKLENQLLQHLVDAPEDILSAVALIEDLEEMKETARETNEAVVLGEATEKGINQARDIYRPAAAEASLLYFMLLKLSAVDPMYQYSLDSFTRFFFKAIHTSKAALGDEKQRVANLRRSLRLTVYTWVTRGLFEKHRLIFLTQVTFGLLEFGVCGQDTGFSAEALTFLLRERHRENFDRGWGVANDYPPPVDWLSAAAWEMVLKLSSLQGFAKLANAVAESEPRFREWFDSPTPEIEKLPFELRELDKKPFSKLLVVRCLRPERVTEAIAHFVRNHLPDGPLVIDIDTELNSFQEVLSEAFKDSDPVTPIYLLLSPGANVSADVDKLADSYGMQRGVTYHDISLGQGQDVVAMDRLDVGSAKGHWVILNNIHLMPRWLPILDKRLEYYKDAGSNPAFRVMLSSDPSGMIPVGILQRCIKLTNDPPSGLRANLKHAFASISREEYEDLEPRTQGILFGLCHFHALMLERKKFGPKGFNMMYSFSSSDLTCSFTVLKNYMENAPIKTPWADLRYMFGEIIYGGHIVNDFDRLVCNAYLAFFLKDGLLDEMPLHPYLDPPTQEKIDPGAESFQAPPVSFSYDQILDHIDATLTGNSPVAFGLHPNAEIGFRTETSEQLLKAILDMSPRDNPSGLGALRGAVDVAEQASLDILEAVHDYKFDLESIAAGCDHNLGPYENILIQECGHMNTLMGEIVRTLSNLCLAYKGDVIMTEQLEEIQLSISIERVPSAWARLAYPSMRSLSLWLLDLQARLTQLSDWAGNPTELPTVTWLAGLFNPQSFLTAIMQVTAKARGLELGKLSMSTNVTKKVDVVDANARSREGAYINGLSLDGARWNFQAQHLESSKPREMYCLMPVINCVAIVSARADSSIFMCPVYKTRQRGPTYVFDAGLRTKSPKTKWVLAGVALVMDTV
ncbi:unnamed protein product [Ascophyllum nodosum]